MNDRQASSGIIRIRIRIVGKQMQPVRIESMRQFSLGFALKCMEILLFVDAEKRYAVPYIATNTYIC